MCKDRAQTSVAGVVVNLAMLSMTVPALAYFEAANKGLAAWQAASQAAWRFDTGAVFGWPAFAARQVEGHGTSEAETTAPAINAFSSYRTAGGHAAAQIVTPPALDKDRIVVPAA